MVVSFRKRTSTTVCTLLQQRWECAVCTTASIADLGKSNANLQRQPFPSIQGVTLTTVAFAASCSSVARTFDLAFDCSSRNASIDNLFMSAMLKNSLLVECSVCWIARTQSTSEPRVQRQGRMGIRRQLWCGCRIDPVSRRVRCGRRDRSRWVPESVLAT